MGQTWDANPIHDAGNVVSDIGGFFSGPPGDPGRIRQVADQIQALRDHFDGDRRALNEAVDELTRTWTGDGGAAFAATWHGDGGTTAPARVLSTVTDKLDGFVKQLRDYADQLEHAQHEHWIQMAIMGALTVVNAAQLGLDPATDAAEVGAGAAVEVGSSFALADIGTFAIQGAAFGFSSDVIAQLGADVWDHLDTQFDQTGDHAVGLFNAQELALTTVEGGAGGALLGSAGLLFRGDAEPAIAGEQPKAFGAADSGDPVPSRLKPTTDTTPEISDVNGDPSPAPVNCTACVKAVDARMTGDSQATADPMNAGVPLRTVEQEWGGPLDQKAWPDIEQDLTQGGDGARGVMTLHAPGGAHIVNVVNDNGTIRILDGQVGKSATGLSDYVRGTMFQDPSTVTRFRLIYPSAP